MATQHSTDSGQPPQRVGGEGRPRPAFPGVVREDGPASETEAKRPGDAVDARRSDWEWVALWVFLASLLIASVWAAHLLRAKLCPN